MKELDRGWLAALGLLAACGPLPPAETGTDGTSGTSTGATTPPTTGPTSGMTTGPLPECVDDGDCGPCGWCRDDSCTFDYCCEYGCCYQLPESGEVRCSPPYWCYSDEGCGLGEVCEYGYCVPDRPPPTVLPACPPGQVDTTQWNLALVYTSEVPLAEGGGWTQALAGQMGVDPHPDLVLVRESDGLVHVWPSVGELGWSEPSGYVTSVASSGGVLADVDEDGFDDLVAATGLALVNVLRGDGANGFTCERVLEVGGATSRELVVVGELDGGPGAEVVVGSRDGPTVTVLRAP